MSEYCVCNFYRVHVELFKYYWLGWSGYVLYMHMCKGLHVQFIFNKVILHLNKWLM